MIEAEKKYRIAFSTYEPDKYVPGQQKMAKIYFSVDILCFKTRDELMEFFDNPDKIFAYLRNTDVLKMILDRNQRGKKVVPVIELTTFLEGDSRENRLYFDERREVEIAVEGGKDNKVHNGNIIDATHQRLWIDKDKTGEWDAQEVKL